MTIKTHIAGMANFIYLRDSALWYQTESGFIFPVPLSDIGTTTFDAQYKGIRLMRWIRKHLDALESARQELQVLTKGDLV
jgi:hypothetical protein